MAINLKAIKPHKISKNLDGYTIYMYGPGGVGKTTFACEIPNSMLFAFEKGYGALNVEAPVDINSWTDIRGVLRQLDDPEIKERFKVIIFDTVDKAAALCEKYICSQLGIENIGDGGWSTNGWSKVKKEWETVLNTIQMKGYTIFFISHSKDKTFKRKDGTEYNQIVPACPNTYNEIVRNLVDIEAYATVEAGSRKLIIRSADESVECKRRSMYMPAEVDFSYQSLSNAIAAAINKEEEVKGSDAVTNEPEKIIPINENEYDYDALMSEFTSLVNELMANNQSNAAKISAIVDTYLGKGKKVTEATREQAEFIYLINEEIKATLL